MFFNFNQENSIYNLDFTIKMTDDTHTGDNKLQETENPHFRIFLIKSGSRSTTKEEEYIEVFDIEKYSPYFTGNTDWVDIRYVY